MAYEQGGERYTFPAATTLGSAQYKFMDLTSTGGVKISASTGYLPLGVLQNAPAVAGQAAVVQVSGISKAKAAASTLAVGDYFAASTAGLVAAASTDTPICGRIVGGSSGAVNRVLSVLLQPWGNTAAP